MGQENSKGLTVLEKTNAEVEEYIGGGKHKLSDKEWFNKTDVKSLSFDAESTDWRWSEEKGPEWYRSLTCQQAIDW